MQKSTFDKNVKYYIILRCFFVTCYLLLFMRILPVLIEYHKERKKQRKTFVSVRYIIRKDSGYYDYIFNLRARTPLFPNNSSV